MPCHVELTYGGKAEEGDIAIPISLKVPDSGSCLSVADIKKAILVEADIDEDPDDMVILKVGPGNILTDKDMVDNGDSLVAALVKEEGGNEKLMKVNVVSDRAVWIVSGNNWGFHVQIIEETNKEVPTTIKMSSIRKWEHKFAVVNRMPTDGNYWIAQRFSLDKKDKNATLEITHENEADDAFSVHLVTYQGEVKGKTLLKPDGVEKVFNKNVVASRKETLTNAVAVGGFVLTLVGTVATLATAGAAAPVAGPIAGLGAVIAAAKAFKK